MQKLLAVSVLSKKVKKKTKMFCCLGRTNYGGLRNVRHPIIDPRIWLDKERTNEKSIIYGHLKRFIIAIPDTDLSWVC